MIFSRWSSGDVGIAEVDLAACGTGVTIGHNVTITNPEKVRLGNNVRIDPNVYISGELSTGDNVQICTGAILGGTAGIQLGSWTFIGYGSKLFTASESYDHLVNEHWGADHVDARPIIFEDFAGIASDVLVMPGVTLQEGCRIGSRSFVYRSPEHPWAIYAGQPLTLIRHINAKAIRAEVERIAGDA